MINTPSNTYLKYDSALLQDIYDSNGSIANTAKALGLSYPTVQRLLKKHNVKTRNVGYQKPNTPISGLQCRHAREYLGLVRFDFCTKAGIGKTTLLEFELGKKTPRPTTIAKILKVFEQNGIAFFDDGTFQVAAKLEVTKEVS